MLKKYAILIMMIALVSVRCSKAFNTAERVADQTVFNADQHVYTYEEFKRQYESFQQFDLQMQGAKRQIVQLEAKGNTKSQLYDNLQTEFAGARQMRCNIAASYNAMSKIAYKYVVKSSDLPVGLDCN